MFSLMEYFLVFIILLLSAMIIFLFKNKEESEDTIYNLDLIQERYDEFVKKIDASKIKNQLMGSIKTSIGTEKRFQYMFLFNEKLCSDYYDIIKDQEKINYHQDKITSYIEEIVNEVGQSGNDINLEIYDQLKDYVKDLSVLNEKSCHLLENQKTFKMLSNCFHNIILSEEKDVIDLRNLMYCFQYIGTHDIDVNYIDLGKADVNLVLDKHLRNDIVHFIDLFYGKEPQDVGKDIHCKVQFKYDRIVVSIDNIVFEKVDFDNQLLQAVVCKKDNYSDQMIITMHIHLVSEISSLYMVNRKRGNNSELEWQTI